MNDTLSQLLGVLFGILFFGVIVASMFWASHISDLYAKRRDRLLRKVLGDDIKITRHFPIDQSSEDIVQGALEHFFQDFRELIVKDNWTFIQLTTRGVPVPTLREERNISLGSLFALTLTEFTPYIVVRHKSHKSFYIHHLQEKITNGELIWCEGVFDTNHDIYNEPGMQLDTLSILSPEVLEAMQNAPGNADIILKRNQLYYFVPGNQPAEDIVPKLLVHSAKLQTELEENLHRWAQSVSNTEKLNAIKNTELSVTLQEKYERNLSQK